MCGNRIVKTSKVLKGKSNIVKCKGTNNLKLKVKKKVFQSIKTYYYAMISPFC